MSEKTPPRPLNPGLVRRKPISCGAFLKWTIITLLVLVVGLYLTTAIANTSRAFSSPHAAYYQNSTIEEVKNRGTVVQPLVNKKQGFDVAVSVWVRAPTASDDLEDTLETPLFSDVVFRDLHTTDGFQFKIIKFRMPNARFREDNLTNFDLRASFVLIPSSPSPMDHLKNFSTWKPSSIKVSPVRSRPFPLHSLESDNSERTMIEEAIDSFGISTPLVQFHPVRSKCPSSDDDDDYDYAEDFDDDGESVANATAEPSAVLKPSLLRTNNGKLPLESHPYIVTRTHLRIVDEERLYNRKMYNKAHKFLKLNSCGQRLKNIQPNEYMCLGSFETNANFETRLEVDGSAHSTDEVQAKGKGSEWFYAPALSVYDHGAGPKDLKPIDVNREKCESTYTNADYTDVEWKVSFTSASPSQLRLASILHRPTTGNDVNQSEYGIAVAHSTSEMINGLHGYRFGDDTHPRRLFTLGIFGAALGFILSILNIVYWYKRTNTYSLSILGLVLNGSSGMLAAFIGLGLEMRKAELWWSTIWGFLIRLVLDPQWFLQLRATLRLEFGSKSEGSWFPWVRRLPATHKERASERLEGQISWMLRGGICVAVVAGYLLLDPPNIMLIAPLHPAPSPEDLQDITKWTRVVDGMNIAGSILQRLFNQYLKLFSGQYKMAVYIVVVLHILHLVTYVPIVSGRIEDRAGYSLHDGLTFVLTGWTTWQAWQFKSVPQNVEDLNLE